MSSSFLRASRTYACLLLLVAIAAAGCGRQSAPPADRSRETRERAYRANNVGVALLEQLKYPEAAEAFRTAIGIDASLGIARLNLALALLYQQDLDGAVREAAEAARLMPSAPQPPYVLGLAARAQNRSADARRYFQQVLQIDPTDVGTNVNLAQIDLEDRRYEQAAAALRPIVAAEPYHITAAYVLGLALTRSGNNDEGQRLLERAQELRRASYAVTFGTGYLEQGRYAEAIASTGAEPELVDPTTPPVAFAAADISSALPTPRGTPPAQAFGHRYGAADLADGGAAIAAALGGGETLADLDGDGALELVVASSTGQRIYRIGANGALTDISDDSGFPSTSPAPAIGVVAADVDNDGAIDLFVLRSRSSSLYRNDGKGRFSDVTRASRLPAYPALPGAAAFVDVDHDGDVDLVIAGIADVAATRRQQGGTWAFPEEFAPAPLQLLRNNGNGTFTDITRSAGLDVRGHAIAVVPTDFDNHRDVDLLIVDADGAPRLYANQRDGTFRDVAAASGLGAVRRPGDPMTAVAAGDVNKDDWPDFLFVRRSGATLAMSDARGRFSVSNAPDVVAGAASAQFVDYDNDGLLDIVALTPRGLVVSRNVGPSWVDATAAAAGSPAIAPRTSLRSLAAADIDRDGDVDLVAASNGEGWLWSNSGNPQNRSLRVQLRGRVTNRAGIGAKVQIRAGSLNARVETSAATPPAVPADIVFGLGARPGAEVVRVLWPSGILQAETVAAENGSPGTLPSPFLVEELDRKPSSCPFLFTWNGERFEFVTDFLGGGEMGYWEGPGAFNHPDPTEYVRIRGDQLQPRNGTLELRVTNELEEVLYLDRLQLIAVDHPADVEVYPNEGMPARPKPYRLHAVRSPRPPVRVVDDHGHDVTDLIARVDRRYPSDFALARIRGYAEPHALTIDVGIASNGQTLLLTGWTDYAFSSDNVAAYQAGLAAAEPALEVRERSGRWRKLNVTIGIPVGRPQTIPIDLSGELRPGEHELRLTTNMRVYWDRISVGETAPIDRVSSTPIEPRTAVLRERGFSREVRPGGADPPSYEYDRISHDSPWKVFAGAFTRTGDVLPLLTGSDDQFVIAKTGDEVRLEFPAPTAVAAGLARTYLLFGDGFSKEMDVNSASPDTVEPLPFHGMSGYPYPGGEQYPDTPAHRAYRDRFNTRRVLRPVPMLQAPAATTR